MGVSTVSSRNFTRDVAAAKQAAADGPVFITDRGQPTHVLLTLQAYERLTGLANSPTLLEAFDALPEAPDIELPVPPRDRSNDRPIPDLRIEP